MYKDAAKYIESKLYDIPEIGLILGSGLGDLADNLLNPVVINYDEIPYFPKTTVAGHRGRFVFGIYNNKKVLAMQGRFHYYEGKDIREIVMPVRVMKILGIKTIIITNAAGGVNKDFNPGDIMLINDHINLSGINPLIGPNDDEFGPRFPDMTYAYDPMLRQLVLKAADKINLKIKTGVYAMMSGPSYETPAEIKMLRTLGADAVGMSTVPEVITAVHANIKVIGLSCITNMAAGILDQPLNHQEVITTADKVKANLVSLINTILSEI